MTDFIFMTENELATCTVELGQDNHFQIDFDVMCIELSISNIPLTKIEHDCISLNGIEKKYTNLLEKIGELMVAVGIATIL